MGWLHPAGVAGIALAGSAALLAGRQLLVRAREPGERRGPDGLQGVLLQECAICLEEAPAEAGVWCRGDGQHFLCRCCFQRHVRVACAPENAAAFGRAGCRLHCPAQPCSAAAPSGSGAQQRDEDAAAQQRAFPVRQVMLRVDDATWAAFEEARRQAYLAQGQREGRALAAAAEQQPQRGPPQQRTDSQQQAQQLDEEVARARNAIIDSALTLLPPCCRGGAVADWDGCFAVRCPWCPQHFCGFCLAFAGNGRETHLHVAGCRLRMPGSQQRGAEGAVGFFAAPGEAAWARRQLLTERLDAAFLPHQRRGDPAFLARLLAAMAADLRDLGLEPARWAAVAAAEGQAAAGGTAAGGAAAGGGHAHAQAQVQHQRLHIPGPAQEVGDWWWRCPCPTAGCSRVTLCCTVRLLPTAAVALLQSLPGLDASCAEEACTGPFIN
jgi:hypothetical protein